MGQWIKWTKGLVRKPEIVRIGDAMSISDGEAAARCMEVWEWADDITVDGFVEGVGIRAVDRIAGDGFGQALIDVGWLIVDDHGLTFPNFQRHNGRSAKARGLDADRKRRSRERVEQ